MTSIQSLAVCIAAALVAAACGGSSSPATTSTTPAATSMPPVAPVVSAVTVEDGRVVVAGRDFAPGVVVNVFQQQGGAAVNLGGMTAAGGSRIAVTLSSPERLSFPVPADLRPGEFFVELVNPPYRADTTSRDEPGAHGRLTR